MTYTIGIGALIQDDAFNHIRAIELATAEAVGNFQGLGQPPHVTLKRPFEVSSIADIQKVRTVMHDIASSATSFNLTLDGINNFADKVWYLNVQKNDVLQQLHNASLDALQPIFPGYKGLFEGEKMVFHSTVTMGLTPELFRHTQKYLQSQPSDTYNFTTSITRLGLFLGIDDNSHWVVIDQVDLER